MNMAYPVSFKTYANGQVGAFFADVPEAITAGATQAQALDYAQDALVVALSSYSGRALPQPGKAKRGQQVVALPPRAAIKLAIIDAMRVQAMTQERLSALMGIDARQVRRVLDLGHESKLSQLDATLAALGLRASVSVEAVRT